MTLEQKLLIFLIIFLLIVGGIIALAISLSVYNSKYRNFVLQHSDSLKQLEIINDKYHFNHVKHCDLSHSYDNETYYGKISTRDYLIYHLAHSQNQVMKSIDAAKSNKRMFENYQKEIEEKCKPGSFDTPEVLPNKKKLLRTENKLFYHSVKQPETSFSIGVYLKLTNIKGAHRSGKSCRFSSSEILELIKRVNNRSGYYFNDQEIWDAVCRVERGKVSNKLRFRIYQRDGWRCKLCGRKTQNLEIDHIIPIAKGGKTTYNNLQTLCHRCNQRKGTDIY